MKPKITKHHLALDTGAGSRRAILGSIQDGKIILKKIHRFKNSSVQVIDHEHWNVLSIYQEILNAFKICVKSEQVRPVSVAIDTWGADYAYLDHDGNLLNNPFAYRDERTNSIITDEVFNTKRKTLAFGIVWDQFCEMNNVPVGEKYITDIKNYEKRVLNKR